MVQSFITTGSGLVTEHSFLHYQIFILQYYHINRSAIFYISTKMQKKILLHVTIQCQLDSMLFCRVTNKMHVISCQKSNCFTKACSVYGDYCHSYEKEILKNVK